MDILHEILKIEIIIKILQASGILISGIVLGKILSAFIKRISKHSSKLKSITVLQKIVFYLVITITIILSMNQLGFDWKILIGTAGVMTIALGFASQTSASNLISGFFLIFEKPFVTGDLIQIGETWGYVLSVDLLSTRLRTFDNILVRIPNESLMKSEFKNHTHFPIRRVDIKVGVAYKENIKRVNEILLDVVDKHPLCLDEPKPFILHNGYGDSSIDLQLNAWTKTENFWNVRTSLYEEVKNAFDKNGIEIPFPHLTHYVGEKTKPFPIKSL